MNNLIDKNINDDEFIEELISDQKKFNDFIYTPLNEALKEIRLRQQNKKIDEHIKSSLIKIPAVFEGKPKAVMFRNITTPNYEMKWFVDIVELFKGELNPLFIEYVQDQFNNRNEMKFALAKMMLHKGKNKKNEPIFEHKNIIDINNSNCKSISSIKTTWGQLFVDFHHELFLGEFPDFRNSTVDFSNWIKDNGHTPKEYYKLFFLFFLKHGILFENYILKSGEFSFIKEVILPTFIKVLRDTGVKPLIVVIQPTEIEEGKFWQAYPLKVKELLVKKLVSG